MSLSTRGTPRDRRSFSTLETDSAPSGTGALLSSPSVLRQLLWLVPALVLGCMVRTWGVRGQILMGDEFHALTSCLNLGLGELLTTYRLADHCIPMAAYDWVLVRVGVPLTELLVRLPALVAGLASLVVLPVCAAVLVERRAAVLFGWLLALSPALIFYSRFARPYSVVVLLGLVAMVSFWRFWERGTSRWGMLYALVAAVATWFHPGAGPFVAAPMAFAALEIVWSGRLSTQRGRLARLTGVGLLFGVLVAAFLVPAAPSFVRLVRMKSGSSTPTLGGVGEALWLLSGSASRWIAMAMAALALLGLVSLLRTRRRVALFTLVPVVCLGLSLAVVRPHLVQVPSVLARYLLIGLPVALLWCACGIMAVWRVGTAPAGGARRVALGLLLAGALATHPYVADPALRFGPFAGTLASLEFNRSPPELPPDLVPLPYRVLAGEPGDEAVVEAPCGIASHHARVQLAAWRFHGRPVIQVTTHPAIADPRIAMRTVVPPVERRIVESGARFVVAHTDRPRLARIIGLLSRGVPAERALARARTTDRGEAEAAEAREVIAALERWWGPASLRGNSVRVWDLGL